MTTPDLRLERAERDRWAEQERHPTTRTTVLYAACRCVDRDHDDHSRMDWCASFSAAHEDGVMAGWERAFHIIACEEVAGP